MSLVMNNLYVKSNSMMILQAILWVMFTYKIKEQNYIVTCCIL
jgi:hypothetical protein